MLPILKDFIFFIIYIKPASKIPKIINCVINALKILNFKFFLKTIFTHIPFAYIQFETNFLEVNLIFLLLAELQLQISAHLKCLIYKQSLTKNKFLKFNILK